MKSENPLAVSRPGTGLCLCSFVLGALALGLRPTLAAGQTDYTPYTFTTPASRASIGSEDGTGSAARFNSPQGVAVDAAGNVYVADKDNHTIRKVTPRHVVTTIAGRAGERGMTDGVGSAARFNQPYAVGLDGAGNLYVADTGNHAIRKVTPEGFVSILAGAPGLPGNADGTGYAARFSKPSGLALDAGGNVYVADSGNDAVRKVTPAGVVTTLADATTGLDEPRGIAVDAAGTVYVGDMGRIRRITAAGVFSTLAGGGFGEDDGTGAVAGFRQPLGLAVDDAGILWAADAGSIRRITPAGAVTTTAYADDRFGGPGDAAADPQFGAPVSLAQDAAGYLYFADVANTIHSMAAGNPNATMLAGFPGQRNRADGTGGSAGFGGPRYLAVDRPGNLYVTDEATSGVFIRQVSPNGLVSTLAGGGPFPFADGTGSAAAFFEIQGIAADPAGILYTTDSFYHQIRKITTPAGVVTTLATGVGELSNIFSPVLSVAADGSGNVYIAVSGYHIIQKISPAGTVSTFAGTQGQPGGADGTGGDARFNAPYALTADRNGNLYVLDASNAGSVRRVTPAGVVTTVATGVKLSVAPALFERYGYGPITTDSPSGIAVDGSGNFYLTYYNLHMVRRIATSGTVTTIGGTAGEPGSADGTANAARFNGLVGIAVDDAGNLYLVDALDNTIRKGQLSAFPVVTTPPASRTVSAGQSAVFTVSAGSVSDVAYRWQRRANGSGAWADLGDSAAYAGTATATLTISAATASMDGDSFRCVVTSASGSVTSDPATLTVIGGTPLTVTTLAGQAGISGRADGTGSAAHFVAPADVATISIGTGAVYVADTDNHTIRSITSDGVVTTLAGQAGLRGNADGTGSAARFSDPAGLAVDNAGIIYVADTSNHTIRKITPTGVVTTLAGAAGASGTLDGVGAAARFNGPSGIVVDATGNLYVADTLNHAIRKVTPSGAVSTPAGAAGWSGSTDGTGSQVRFYGPQGLALDGAGNLYIVDTNNNTLRKLVLATGGVSTFAGQSRSPGSADGSANLARFSYPSGIAADGTGNLYVADTDNHTIRQITPAGTVSTVAGLAGTSGVADGVGTAARFTYPTGIAVDAVGNLYIADTNNHTIRTAYLPTPPVIMTQPSSRTVSAGANVEFLVLVTGKPAPTYQWNFNGNAISGATSNSLNLSTVQAANAGTYTVTVTNPSGSVTSSAATLAVTAAPSGSSGSAANSGGGAMEAWLVFALGLLLLVRRLRPRFQPTVLILAAGLLAGGSAFAQPRLRVLHTFAGGPADGADPQGSVAVSGTVIYGMTRAGGTADLGTLFKCGTDGTGFALVHAFAGGDGDGARPYQTGAPIIDGTVIYGMTNEGGSSGLGTIFRINTDGTGFTLLHVFAGGAGDGAHPRGSLTLSGKTLYGMTSDGGESGQGTVFRIGIDGSEFGILHSFFGTPSPSDAGPGGAHPQGTLTLIDSTLYGMACFTTYSYYRDPIVFRLNTDGTGYTRIANFCCDYQTGESLTAVGSTLYGLTGTSWYTNAHLFAIQADGTGLSELHTFMNTGVRYPANTPTVDGDTLFFYSESMMPYGDYPHVYRMNTDGTGFAEVAALGASPVGSLTLSRSILYEMDSRRLVAVIPDAPKIEKKSGAWIFPVAVGSDVTFSTTAEGASPLAFQWQRMAAGIGAWTDLTDDATYSGTTTANLTVHAVTAEMCGDQYRLVCSNILGDDAAEFSLVTFRPLTVTTIAGAPGESGSADGSGTQARFTRPTDLAVDSAGNVFIADTDNHLIRKLTPTGMVSTIAGTAGVAGAADGTGSNARFNRPSGIAVDRAGNVYVADTDNDTIRRITPAGVVTTIAGLAGSAGSADGNGAAARFNKPSGIVLTANGTLFVADTLNHTIRQISPVGLVTTLAGAAGISGSADGTGSAARFFGAQGLATDNSGNLLITDTNNHTIRTIVVSTGVVTTFVGNANDYASSIDGPPSRAAFYAPTGVAVDHAGFLYVVDSQTNQIRAITPQGGVSTPAGDYDLGANVDGVGDAVRFNHPTGIAISPNGDLYVADADNHTIRLAYVPGPLAITAQPQDLTVASGAGATFSVVVTGHPAPTYQWHFNGAALAGATGNTLSVPNAQSANAGAYTVTVTNDSGSVTSNPAMLTVTMAPTVPPTPGGSSTSSGGGAMAAWYVAALALLIIARRVAANLSANS